jgi:hypothetical protein
VHQPSKLVHPGSNPARRMTFFFFFFFLARVRRPVHSNAMKRSLRSNADYVFVTKPHQALEKNGVDFYVHLCPLPDRLNEMFAAVTTETIHSCMYHEGSSLRVQIINSYLVVKRAGGSSVSNHEGYFFCKIPLNLQLPIPTSLQSFVGFWNSSLYWWVSCGGNGSCTPCHRDPLSMPVSYRLSS